MRAPSEPVKDGSADMEEFARNVARIIEEGGKAMAAYLKPREEGQRRRAICRDHRRREDARPGRGILAARSPARARTAVEPGQGLSRALGQCGQAHGGRDRSQPVAAPDPRDKRFADPEWSSNQFFDFLKQAYLLTVQWANRLVRDAEGLDPHTLQKAEFYVRQIANAISPSNFVLTNPELLRETLASKAENLVRGMHMLAEDIEAGHGNLQDPPVRLQDVRGRPQSRAHARQGDFRERADAAHPVRAVDRDGAQAAAPDRAALDQQVLHPRSHAGKILHQVVRRPGAHRIRHLLGQSGRQARQEKLRGLHARGSARRARRRSRRRPASARSTRSAIASAERCWPPRSPTWQRKRDDRIASATFFAAQVDFTYAGDLKVFVDEEQIAAREREMGDRGYLEGKKMANAFNLLRSNDLIWPYVINNYLKGKEPAAVRPALLEFGFDADAGGEPLVLSAQLLPGEPAAARARW